MNLNFFDYFTIFLKIKNFYFMDLPTTILINNSLAVIANINNVELGSILYVFSE